MTARVRQSSDNSMMNSINVLMVAGAIGAMACCLGGFGGRDGLVMLVGMAVPSAAGWAWRLVEAGRRNPRLRAVAERFSAGSGVATFGPASDTPSAAPSRIDPRGSGADPGADEKRSAATERATMAEGATLRRAVEAMATIRMASSRIGEISATIDEMAFQTDLLGLTAGIEAARAGAAGRSFAAVASDIRGLVRRSAEAANAIKALAVASTCRIDESLGQLSAAGHAFDRIALEVGAGEDPRYSAPCRAAGPTEAVVPHGDVGGAEALRAAGPQSTRTTGWREADPSAGEGNARVVPIERFRLHPNRSDASARGSARLKPGDHRSIRPARAGAAFTETWSATGPAGPRPTVVRPDR